MSGPGSHTPSPTSSSIPVTLAPTKSLTLQPTLSVPTSLAPTPTQITLAPTPAGFDPSVITSAPTTWGTSGTWTTTDTIITSVVVGVVAILLGLFIWSYTAAMANKAGYKPVSGTDNDSEAGVATSNVKPPPSSDTRAPPPPKEARK